MARALKKSKALLFLLLIVPLLVIIFISLLVIQGQQVRRLQIEKAAVEDDLTIAAKQADFYKQAYDVTLHDVMTLSRIYGGEQKYSKTAGRLRAQELSVVFAKQNISGPVYEAKNPGLWAEYVNHSVIRTECLPAPFQINTVSDELLLVLTANATGERDLFIYLDGNLIERFPVVDSTSHILNLKVPAGLHEVTLLSKTGGVSVTQLYLDTIPYALNQTVADRGQSWDVFDCADAVNSTSLVSPGAFRILLNKTITT